MGPLLLASTLTLSPYDLVRVDDPDFPGALFRSETGAVLAEPPPSGVPWRHEPVPHPDGVVVADEALQAISAHPWHERGVRGQGVRVAVFDVQWFGAPLTSEVLGTFQTHDCLSHPSCLLPIEPLKPRFSFEVGRHGPACAEVVRAVAPEAELHLVQVSSQTSLENAVRWAIREGIDVITMSMSFFNSSFYDGTGRVNALMDDLEAAGILMVTSAGNTARGHWTGPFTDGDHDGRMDFDGDGGLYIYLGGGLSRGIYVTWNQFGSCGTTDLDAYLYDMDGRLVASAEARQQLGADRCEPLEIVRGLVQPEAWYRLEVVHRAGPVAGLQVSVLTPEGRVHGTMPQGSITDPGTHPGVLTVGAVRARDYLYQDIEAFSSQGPTRAGVQKPDLAAPNGLTTHTYGAGGFFGTSAASPVVAGMVALVMSSDPGLGPQAAAERLKGWAINDQVGPGRLDPRWGWGKARLPAEPDPEPGCGRRPLLLSLLLPPLAWLRRRRPSA